MAEEDYWYAPTGDEYTEDYPIDYTYGYQSPGVQSPTGAPANSSGNYDLIGIGGTSAPPPAQHPNPTSLAAYQNLEDVPWTRPNSIFNTGYQTSTPIIPSKPVPLDQFVAPVRDEARIEELTQKRASPGLRAMRQKINQLTNRSFENPNFRKSALREALAGYGTGLSQVMGSADVSAERQYQNEFNTTMNTSMLNWKVEQENKKALGEWNDIVSKLGSTGGSPTRSPGTTGVQYFNKMPSAFELALREGEYARQWAAANREKPTPYDNPWELEKYYKNFQP